MRVDSSVTTNEARGLLFTDHTRHTWELAGDMSCQQLHLPLPPPLVSSSDFLARPFVHDKYSEGKKLVLEGLARDFKRLFPPNAVQRKHKHFHETTRREQDAAAFSGASKKSSLLYEQ